MSQHIIPAWDSFVDSDYGKELLAKHPELVNEFLSVFNAGLQRGDKTSHCPITMLPCGVWFENREYYRYKGKQPIVVECKDLVQSTALEKDRFKYVVLHGCISCQLGRVMNGQRWMILPV